MAEAVEQGMETGLSDAEVERLRKDFPILEQRIHDKPLVYLDNAATAQKPKAVIDAVRRYYECDNANVHRGVHLLSQRATDAYEGARATVARFMGAGEPREIVFTRGTTEAVNLVAQSFGRANVGAGDEVLVTRMEHHSNIVPWQLLCEETGATLRVAPMDESGALDLAGFRDALSDRTKLVAVTHVSNALGTVNPVQEIVELAHAAGARVLVDGAQAAPHMPVRVAEIGCDFYAISGHKMFGPTGVGALWARAELLEAMPPWQGGGEMITTVSFEKTEYAEIPNKFEAGTPNIAGAVGLGAAVDYLEQVGLQRIARREAELLAYGTRILSEIPEVRLVGTAPNKAGVISFVLDDVHPHDVGTVLDMEGIAMRTGHHCAQPVMEFFGLPATARASLAFYNTRQELDLLGEGIRKVLELFS